MAVWEIRAEIPPSSADAADLALQESGSGEWSILEDAVGRRAWVVGIFATEASAVEGWHGLRGSLPGTASDAAPRRLEDCDWKHSYRGHFKAWAFGRLHWVPVWERGTYRPPPGHSVLWLDPGMAFGTGNHETTRLCIERLVEFEAGLGRAKGVSVVDAGCGSGILALSASLLGFGEVRGFDNDPEAVRVSLENAELNGLRGAVRFEVGGLPDGLGRGGAGVLLANIQADVLSAHAPALAAAVAPGGLLAMSGILAVEAAAVRAAFRSSTPGWQADSRVLGEWSDLALRRPADA